MLWSGAASGRRTGRAHGEEGQGLGGSRTSRTPLLSSGTARRGPGTAGHSPLLPRCCGMPRALCISHLERAELWLRTRRFGGRSCELPAWLYGLICPPERGSGRGGEGPPWRAGGSGSEMQQETGDDHPPSRPVAIPEIHAAGIIPREDADLHPRDDARGVSGRYPWMSQRRGAPLIKPSRRSLLPPL